MAVGRVRSPDQVPAAQSGVPRETNDLAETDVPRETHRAAGTDLQGRLKQLAPNHPSSSARDDASRQPAPPDWTDDESATETIRDTTSAPRDQTDQGDPDRAASAPRDLRPTSSHSLTRNTPGTSTNCGNASTKLAPRTALRTSSTPLTAPTRCGQKSARTFMTQL